MQLMNAKATKTFILPEELEPDTITQVNGEGEKAVTVTVPNPKAGKPKKGASVFTLRALTSSEDGILQDKLYDMSKSVVTADGKGEATVNLNVSMSASGLSRDRVRLGLVGWKNVIDHEGKQVEFVTEGVQIGMDTRQCITEELMELIPISTIQRLSIAIQKASNVSKEEGNA